MARVATRSKMSRTQVKKTFYAGERDLQYFTITPRDFA